MSELRVGDRLMNSSEPMVNGKRKLSTIAGETVDNKRIRVEAFEYNDEVDTGIWESLFNSKAEATKGSPTSPTTDQRSLLQKTIPPNVKETEGVQETSFSSKAESNKCSTASATTQEIGFNSKAKSNKYSTASATSDVRKSPRKPVPLGNGKHTKEGKTKDTEEMNHVIKSHKRDAPEPLSSKSVNANDKSNGLEGVVPKVGMEIDVCDKEYIWSSAIIVKVDRKRQPTKCQIRYNGWGKEWDEILVWENHERLARISYFTIRALCIVDLKMGKKCPWPCIANLRMPNPKCSVEGRCIGEESLRQEKTAFIQPYGLKEGLFTKHIAEQFAHGGKWMRTEYITEWKNIDEIANKSKLKNFGEAYDLAKSDKTVTIPLPSAPFDTGSLLKHKYRTKILKGGIQGRSISPRRSIGDACSGVTPRIVRGTQQVSKPKITDFYKMRSKSLDSSHAPKVMKSHNKAIAGRRSSTRTIAVDGSQNASDVLPTQSRKESWSSLHLSKMKKSHNKAITGRRSSTRTIAVDKSQHASDVLPTQSRKESRSPLHLFPSQRGITLSPLSCNTRVRSNGLKGVKPKLGMSIDICDKDCIWSSGKITKLHPGQTYRCSVRYDGWGQEWDEAIIWTNTSRRIARVSTYTKRALCIVYLNKSTPWPCILNLRMPNPNTFEQQQIHAQVSLSKEKLVFIQPYGLKEKLIPDYIAKKVSFGGMWLDTKNVFCWKELHRISSRDKVTNFSEAYELAMRDINVKATLPTNAFQKGSLLREMYRVQLSSDFKNEEWDGLENGSSKNNSNESSSIQVSLRKNEKAITAEVNKKIYSSREKSSRSRHSSSTSHRKKEMKSTTSQEMEETYIPATMSTPSFDFEEFDDKPNGLKEPTVGMPVDCCDKDNIWSSVTVLKVHSGPPLRCTIRYDGWDSGWDEIITWHNNSRLAPLSTFSQRVRCIVHLHNKIPWPCVLNIRLPNPKCSEKKRIHSEFSLWKEKKIFVQPYGMTENLLPPQIKKQILFEGIWVDRERVKAWEDLVDRGNGIHTPNVETAYSLAVADKSITMALPENAFQSGSLLKEEYRFSLLQPKEAREPSGIMAAVKKKEMSATTSRLVSSKEPLLVLPAGRKVKVNDMFGSCVVKLEMINRWGAYLHYGGKNHFLGSFESQDEAAKSIRRIPANPSPEQLSSLVSNITASSTTALKRRTKKVARRRSQLKK